MVVLSLLLGWLTSDALAGTTATDCLDCCRESGLSGCATELYVVGEASKVYKEGTGWRASGLYVVSCDGRGFFDDGRTTVFSSVPAAGDVAKSSSAQWACFAKSCLLPTGLCFDPDAGHVSVCDTGAGPSPANFRAAPGPRAGGAPASFSAAPSVSSSASTTAAPPGARPTPVGAVTVIVGGRELEVQVAQAQAAPPASTTRAPVPPITTAYTPGVASPVAPPSPATSQSPYTTADGRAPVAPPPAKPKPSTGILFDDLDDDEILADLKAGVDTTLNHWPSDDQRAEGGGGIVGGVVGPVVGGVMGPVVTGAPAATWTPSATSTYTPSSTPSPASPSAFNTPPPASTLAKPDAIAQLTEGLPRDPPSECEAPMEALRGEARKQVMTGDDLRMGKDAAGAIQKYRAALSMDSCNGYAWLGLGESAVALSRPDIAIRALRNATTLMPQHYGAWTELGQCYEAIGQAEMAVGAYKKAVALKPGLEIPLAGLQRLGQ